ncbi:LacI family DNA-binding transcriptional regulator [Amycolatopsis acidicola]|uniref:LacI family DNA-binding transcriptional regulator n=1 Tax=Amycolatopsis acidicola TaxID=2596893 RepID=UPI00140E2169|nr:LacI family DNA-binding transcriptional regulator [Amycolatopsis acidicola]
MAREAGVSTATVSRVIRETGYPVSATARQRVVDAVRKLGYYPNDLARSLLSERTNNIGVIVPDLSNPHYPAVMIGLEEIASRHSYSVILHTTDEQPEKLATYLKSLASKRVDGVVLAAGGTDPDEESLRAIADMRMPAVVVGRYTDTRFPTVESNNHLAGKLAAEHLRQLGHRRIGILTGPPESSSSADRTEGAIAFLTSNGAPVDESLVVGGDYLAESGYLAARQLLGLAGPPTALIAATDRMAAGAMAAAHDLGLSLPDQLSIVGYDNIDIAQYLRPALTTISLPDKLMGRMAMTKLHELINGRAVEHHSVLDVQLIVRASTSPAS